VGGYVDRFKKARNNAVSWRGSITKVYIDKVISTKVPVKSFYPFSGRTP